MRKHASWLALVVVAAVSWTWFSPGPADWSGTLSADGSLTLRRSGESEPWKILPASTLSDERDLYGSWIERTATKDYPSSSVSTHLLTCFQDGTILYQ